jgi:hypothetical protein
MIRRYAMRTSMKQCFGLAVTVALSAFLAAPATAQTPDENTPAEEAVCDGQVGAAYGLCNAYCEAMDCDSDYPQASETACNKVGNKFMNLTGVQPPCECPCFEELPGFADFVNGQTDIAVCWIYEGDTQIEIWEVFPSGTPGTDLAQSSIVHPIRCVGGTVPFPPYRDISLEQAENCYELLLAAASNQGVTCEPVPSGP